MFQKIKKNKQKIKIWKAQKNKDLKKIKNLLQKIKIKKPIKIKN